MAQLLGKHGSPKMNYIMTISEIITDKCMEKMYKKFVIQKTLFLLISVLDQVTINTETFVLNLCQKSMEKVETTKFTGISLNGLTWKKTH